MSVAGAIKAKEIADALWSEQWLNDKVERPFLISRLEVLMREAAAPAAAPPDLEGFLAFLIDRIHEVYRNINPFGPQPELKWDGTDFDAWEVHL
jgi:hypothetical protein